MKFVGICTLVLGLGLSGCMSMSGFTADPNNAAAVTAAVKINHDDFKKMTYFTGPEASLELGDEAFFRAWKDDASGVVVYQLYVQEYYSGEWAFFGTAYDSEGNKIPVTQISKKVNSCGGGICSKVEDVGLDISREYLDLHKVSGIKIQLSGQQGERIITIPGPSVQGFLAVIDVANKVATQGKVGVGFDNKLNVVLVKSGSPAELAGIRVGDKLLEIDGVQATSQLDSVSRITGAPGTKVVLKVSRGSEEISYEITRGQP